MNVQNVDINGVKIYTVISLFAGCGGSSLGYKIAGFKELLAIDFDENSVETFRLNFKDIPIWQKDINEISGKEILDFCKIEKGNLDILDGSPPCQGFSISGKRIIRDKRNDLIIKYISLVNEIYPKIFIMENVSGLIKGKFKGLFIEYIKKMKALNYNIKCKLLNAKYYGIPQSRQRLIWIGIRKDFNKEPVYPITSKKIISVKMAWRNLPEQEKEIKEQNKIKNFALYEKIKKLKKGENLSKYYNYGFNTARLNWHKPSRTIMKSMEHIAACNGLIHPDEDRKLTLTELKRLSSFPDNFKFTDWKNGWMRIGNSVPPKMMYHIAKTIKKKILKVKKDEK